MKVGGGLYYVTGPMGSGKSLFGVRYGVDTITRGKYWITNQRLYPDAFDRMAFHNARTKSRARRARLAAAYESFYVYETDLREAMKYRIPGRGEGRALFTWDETHNDLNNRTYKDREQSLLEWATQLRKLGFVGFLLSQHHMNTDAQLRRISNGIVMLVNQREQTRVLGLRVTPWPLFLGYWFPAHVPGGTLVKPWRVDRYFLSWHRKLYDTHDLYHGLALADELSEDVVLLPPQGRRAEAQASPPPAAGNGPPSDPAPTTAAVPPSLKSRRAPLPTEPSGFPDEIPARRGAVSG